MARRSPVPTVKGLAPVTRSGTTQPGHNVDGGFRPVLNAGPDLSEVTQPGRRPGRQGCDVARHAEEVTLMYVTPLRHPFLPPAL